MQAPLLDVQQVCVSFGAKGFFGAGSGSVRALRSVSLQVGSRETVGLVGESGSGKTTLSRAILRLQSIESGRILFDGLDVHGLPGPALNRLRRRMQMIFQDPRMSLNPRMSAGRNIAEALILQPLCRRDEIPDRVASLMRQVGLLAEAAGRYPHEFSGGQRQRIGIARALAVEPDLLIADEPVSALDMSIQAQILNLLVEQQRQRGLSMLVIGHDLPVIRHLCDRVVVLYRGNVVEAAPTQALFDAPAHPYTRALLDAAPASHPALRRLPEETPAAGPGASETGCLYAPRCASRRADCVQASPELRGVGADHTVACFHPSL